LQGGVAFYVAESQVLVVRMPDWSFEESVTSRNRIQFGLFVEDLKQAPVVNIEFY